LLIVIIGYLHYSNVKQTGDGDTYDKRVINGGWVGKGEGKHQKKPHQISIFVFGS
jgi:hypothetical protein